MTSSKLDNLMCMGKPGTASTTSQANCCFVQRRASDSQSLLHTCMHAQGKQEILDRLPFPAGDLEHVYRDNEACWV